MKSTILLAVLGTALLAEPCTAQTRGGFEAGLKATDYNYRERLDGTTIVRDDGPMVGLVLGYTETLGGGWFLRVTAEATSGSIDYEDDTGERIENVSQTTGHAEIHIGRDFRAGRATITPFAGVGSRSLDDESGGETSTSGLFGYDREIAYRYIPVGVAATVPIGGRRRLLLSAQVNWIVSGHVDSDFSTIDPDLPAIRNRLRGGHGFRLSAMAELPVGRHAVRIGPVIEHWRVGRSRSTFLSEGNETIEFFEPANRTTMIGAVLSFAF